MSITIDLPAKRPNDFDPREPQYRDVGKLLLLIVKRTRRFLDLGMTSTDAIATSALEHGVPPNSWLTKAAFSLAFDLWPNPFGGPLMRAHKLVAITSRLSRVQSNGRFMADRMEEAAIGKLWPRGFGEWTPDVIARPT